MNSYQISRKIFSRKKNLPKPIVLPLLFLKPFMPSTQISQIFSAGKKCGDYFIFLLVSSLPYSHFCVHTSLFKTIFQNCQRVTSRFSSHSLNRRLILNVVLI